MSGETTTVSPGRTRAGSWKHSDLPPPVGQHGEHVFARERITDDFLLQRAERGKAEVLFQRREELVAAEIHPGRVKRSSNGGEQQNLKAREFSKGWRTIFLLPLVAP